MLAIAALGLAAAGTPFLAGAAIAAPAKGTVVAAATGPFGPMLVVGSGRYAGYTLYMITSDRTPTFGCTTKVVNLLGQNGSCSGPSNDKKAEWPAITTTAAPVAGTGVSQKLLGTVSRPGIGLQITYAGHPLYLFDQGPGQTFGEGWDEPSLPPWHGVWYVVSPAGSPLAPSEMLTTTTVKTKAVLGALMFTQAGWEIFPVYSYSKDSATASACAVSCAASWPPLLTTGTPGVLGRLAASDFGTLKRPDGTLQVTYRHKPLYLYSEEGISQGPTGFAATGSGDGAKDAAGGTFQLVAP
ncbi:MAG TPA: hypothetical protein VMU75_01250 [Acidimicrobiales bacterium]|nr:hypothetical protein [Acidimicrobiales bacterium]